MMITARVMKNYALHTMNALCRTKNPSFSYSIEGFTTMLPDENAGRTVAE
jgi:hypothetical protein